MEYLGRTSRWLCCKAKLSHEPHGVYFMQPLTNQTLQHFLWKCIKNDRNMVFTVLSHSVKGTGPSYSTCILRPFTSDGTKCGAWFCGTGIFFEIYRVYEESSSQDKKISRLYLEFDTNRLWENWFVILQNVLNCERPITKKEIHQQNKLMRVKKIATTPQKAQFSDNDLH